LVERPVVDRVQAQAVLDDGLAAILEVSDDVGGIEEPHLLEPADRAAVAVCGEDDAAEARLMHARPDPADDIASLDRILEQDGLSLVDRPDELSERDNDRARSGVVRDDEAWMEALVSPGPSPEEVENRNLQLVRSTESPIVRVVKRPIAVGVHQAVGGDLVVVRRLVGREDRKRRRPALSCGAVDPLLVVEERHATAAVVESTVEPVLVGDVLSELGREHLKGGPTGGADVLVAHRPILRPWSATP